MMLLLLRYAHEHFQFLFLFFVKAVFVMRDLDAYLCVGGQEIVFRTI